MALDRLTDGNTEAQGCEESSQRSHGKLDGHLSPSLSDKNGPGTSPNRTCAQNISPAWGAFNPTPLFTLLPSAL